MRILKRKRHVQIEQQINSENVGCVEAFFILPVVNER